MSVMRGYLLIAKNKHPCPKLSAQWDTTVHSEIARLKMSNKERIWKLIYIIAETVKWY